MDDNEPNNFSANYTEKWHHFLQAVDKRHFKDLFKQNKDNLLSKSQHTQTQTHTHNPSYSLRMMYLFLFTASSSSLTSVKENLGLDFNPPLTPPTLSSSSSSRHGADMAELPPRPLLLLLLLFVWRPPTTQLWVRFHVPPGPSRPDPPASLDSRHLSDCKGPAR